MKNRTTIQISKALRKELKAKKKYSRETFDEQIRRLMKKDKRRLK